MAETSILDDVKAASDELEGVVAEQAPEVAAEPAAVETDEAKAERARDEAGRFAKQPKERTTLKLKETPEKPQAAPSKEAATAVVAATPSAAPAAPLTADGKPILETDRDGKILPRLGPPPGWDGIANLQWDRVPRPIRETIVNKYAEIESARQELLPVKELFDVNREFLVNQAGSIPEAMRQMMQFARMSIDNPVQLAQHILQARGIDPRAAFSGQPQAPTQGQQPDVQALLAQLVDQRIQPILAEREQQQTQQLQTTIDQFATRQDRPFFNDVRVHMGQLIQAGAAKSLDEAYEQATWANPAIRAHLMQEATEATKQAQAAQVKTAQKAIRASVTGSPLTGALNGKGDPKANALDDVRSAFAELSGA